MISTLKVLRGAALVTGILTVGSAIADTQAIRYYEDAFSRFNSGDSNGALIQLRNSLQRDPTQLPARVLMGRIYLDLGNPLLAEEELVMAGKLGADPALIALPLAKARNRLGKYEEVIEDLQPTAYPLAMRADLWAELGKARLGNNDPAGAEIAYAEALRLVPHHESTMLNQAWGLMQRGSYAEAAPLVADLLSRYPENAEAWFLMASVQQTQGEFEGALAHYRQALQLDPKHQRAALGEAMALLGAGQSEQAAGLLQQVLAADPGSLQAHYLYIRALKELDRKDEATVALRQASDLVSTLAAEDLSNDSNQLLLAATVTFENAEYESAYRFLTKYLEYEPQDLRAGKQLARLLMKMNKPAEASRLLTRLKLKDPDDPQLPIMLGDVNSNLHDYAAAERYYQFALDKLQANPVLIGRIGLSQLQQGQTDAAIETFRELVDQDGSANVGASVFLGILYFSDRRLVEAREVADRVAGLQPDNLVALNLQAAVTVEQGDRTLGRQRLEAILNKAPGFHPARINLIKLDILEGRYLAAEESLDALLQTNPKDPFALQAAARLAVSRNDRRAAIQYLEQIRQQNLRAVRPLVELANLYVADGRPADGLKIVQALNRQVPNSLIAKKGLAEVQLAGGDKDLARSTLEDATRLAGVNPQQLVAVARLQVKAGAFEEAERNLLRALKERPQSSAAGLGLADLMARQGRFPQAAAEVMGVLEYEPDNVTAIALLADIKSAQGRYEEAGGLYRRALSLSNRPELVVSLHRAQVKAGRVDKALAELRAWHDAHPGQGPVMRALAGHLQQTGKTAAARQLYTELAALEPQNAEVHNNLANLLLPVDAELALATAMRAYELEPQSAAVLDTLGWMLVQVGELDRGLSYLRDALVRNSRVPTIRYHLAVALEEYGNKAEARQELQLALAMKMPFPERDEATRRLMLLQSGR